MTTPPDVSFSATREEQVALAFAVLRSSWILMTDLLPSTPELLEAHTQIEHAAQSIIALFPELAPFWTLDDTGKPTTSH